MTFLALQPLTEDLLPAVIDLDQRCFGGLWTLDGYRRELNSPNSELLVLQALETEPEETRKSLSTQNSSHTPHPTPHIPTQNSKLKTQNSLPPLLGIGCYWAILEEAHITIVGIAPEYQRQGLGQALFFALLQSAYLRGLERSTLEVRISNQSALSLYQKFGFREAGRRKRYYQDTGEDALILWRGGLQSPEFPELLQNWWKDVCKRLHQFDWQLSTGWNQPMVKEPGLTW